MHCLKCGTLMQLRGGKYGNFYYCPAGAHGTISVDKYRTIVTNHTRMLQHMQHRSASIVPGHPGSLDPLVDEINKQGYVSDEDSFLIDCEAYYNDPTDPRECWMAVSPY